MVNHPSAGAVPDETASRRVYAADWFEVGSFRAPPAHPRWSRENCFGPAGIVFPRTPVQIAQADRKPVVTHPALVMLYDDQQVYRADLVSERGDECEWFRPASSALLAAAREVNERFCDTGGRLFSSACAPCTSGSYALQRRIFEHVTRATAVDHLWVEEAFAQILHETLLQAWSIRGKATWREHSKSDRQHHALVVEACRYLSKHMTKPLQLSDLARELGISLFHLCRVFRAHAGASIHACLTRMRLARSLELLAESDTPIAQIALHLGFSSQSHFTDAFRQHYHTAPAAWRRMVRTR